MGSGFKTFTATTLSSSDMNGYVMKQCVVTCTSGTRPTTSSGQPIWQSDTNTFRYYDGTNWDYFPGAVVSTTTGANTVTSTGTTEVVGSGSGLTLSSLTLSSTRPYRLEFLGRASQSATASPILIKARVSTGAVTTSSTLLWVWQIQPSASGGPGAFDLTHSIVWTPASTGTWNIALCVASGAGGTNASFGPGNSNPVITLYGA